MKPPSCLLALLLLITAPIWLALLLVAAMVYVSIILPVQIFVEGIK